MHIAQFLVLSLLLPAAAFADARGPSMNAAQMQTHWTRSVPSENPLPEYPRPQLVRPQWQNLNGLWDYAVTENDTDIPATYSGKILVPYPIESTLSGVRRQLLPEQRLWYRRTLVHDPKPAGDRTLLHFGAIDYLATVHLNGKELGTHAGGYQSFTFDVTGRLKAGDNELVVKVHDPSDTGPNPRGKQTLNPKGIHYTAASGIWQTVWLETVPRTYIERLRITADIDRSVVKLEVTVEGDAGSHTVVASAREGTAVVAKATAPRGVVELHIPQPRLWSPEDPYLYELEVRLLRSGKTIDKAESYFGMRKIEIRNDSAGVTRLFLNNRYVYQLGVLDQGYSPDGIYTAPTDTALRFGIEAIKAMGFNTIRKHAKVESDRWYYHCDKLGLLVWQDMVPPGDRTSAAREQFETEVRRNLEQLHNHPSIVLWVLFNEGWGAFDQVRLARWVKHLDPSRPLNAHSGSFDEQRIAQWKRNWDPGTLAKVLSGEVRESTVFLEELRHGNLFDPASWEGSDVSDVHVYPGPVLPPDAPGKARVLGEFGGIGVPIESHTWGGLPGWGYSQKTPDQLLNAYAEMTQMLKALESQGLSASIFTQLFDVESEQNGLITYDREVIKIPVQELRRINSLLNSSAQSAGHVIGGFFVRDADMTPEAARYRALLSLYRAGNRETTFLRRLALMAVRQGDQAIATAAGNEFVGRMKSPYTKNDWMFVSEVTQTSKDKGFELLRTLAEQADGALGVGMAERKVREVIKREEIEPYIAKAGPTPDWKEIENKATARHEDAARDVVYEAAMLYYLGRQDWPNYGKYFAAYFDTVRARGGYAYNLVPLSRMLAQHVSDPKILNQAVKFFERDIDLAVATSDVLFVSTYAKVLYKARRVQEAIAWHEKALQLKHGTNDTLARELQDQLRQMKQQTLDCIEEAQVHECA